MATPDPLRQLPDGTPCWCVDPERENHEPRCQVHRIITGVPERPAWLTSEEGISGAGSDSVLRANARKKAARQAAFLAAYSEWGIIGTAADHAGVDRTTVYGWRKASKEFADAMDAALEEATDKLEREAIRRAAHGWEEPVYQQGREVGTVRKYSDQLLALMLKANRPRRFRENVSAEVSGPNGGPIAHAVLPTMDDHEKEALRRVLEEAIAAQRALDVEASETS